jgi:hypothetical protein
LFFYSLKLSGDQIDESCTISLANLVKQNALQTLHVRQCKLPKQAAGQLCASVGTGSLKEIDISMNDLSVAARKKINSKNKNN